MVAKAIVKKARQIQGTIDMNYPDMSSKEAEYFIKKLIEYQSIWLISEVHKCPNSVTNLKKMIM